jgi:Ran GTPase-activating protein (RanGAP) involved in mRNA processing and transport
VVVAFHEGNLLDIRNLKQVILGLNISTIGRSLQPHSVYLSLTLLRMQKSFAIKRPGLFRHFECATMSPTTSRNARDAVGSMYGSVKLKKTGVAIDMAPRINVPTDYNGNCAMKLQRTGSANTKVSSANGGSIDKSFVFRKQEATKVFAVPTLKKAPIVRKSTFESSSSLDSFDSTKLRKVERAKGPPTVISNETRTPVFSLDALKSTGKVAHTLPSLVDQDAPSCSHGWMTGVLSKMTDDAKDVQEKAIALYQRIQQAAGGEAAPTQRRLSISDNDLVTRLSKASANDASTVEIVIDSDERFKNVKPDIVVGCAEGIRTNLNLRKLVVRNVGLGNDFLSALADSIRTNFMLEYIDLSNNAFTNDGLVDFCLGMADNESLLYVNLVGQQSHIFTLHEDLAVQALQCNTTVLQFQVEFQTLQCTEAVQEVVKRNNATSKQGSMDYGKKLLEYLEKEAIMAEKRYAERKLEVREQTVGEDDMPYLFELSERATRYKLPYDKTDDAEPPNRSLVAAAKDIKTSLSKITASILSADGSFLTQDFISQYLVLDALDGSLTFDFNNQGSVFRRFSVTDPARAVIVQKFVDAIVQHPQAHEITHIAMVNTLIGNDWIVCLAQRCLMNATLLPNLHFLNLETNFISGAGVIALAKCIADPNTWKYLQAVKLDNQKQMISSDAEDDLARALCTNRSVIKLSLRIRNTYERRQINKYITRNIEFLRQARRWNAIKTGTVKERARNKVEVLFDSIAANDASISSVELIADQVFLTLHPDEVIKAAKSFASNTYVSTIKMSGLRLDDAFAMEMAKSLQSNKTIAKLDLETNFIGTDGVIAIVSSLALNCTVSELLLRHQSKALSSFDEERIPEVIAGNSVISKLSIDVRSTISKHSIDRKLRQNQERKRSSRSLQRSSSSDSASGIRNRIQKLFDSVASNDPSISEVTVVCDQVFLSMNSTEILKTASCFCNNASVRRIKMSGLRLDDEWAKSLAKSLETNTTIEAIDLESNSIGSDGIMALVTALSANATVAEVLLRHQSKPISSLDEERIPNVLADNKKVIKLSIDVRGTNARCWIDQKLRRNQELKRKNRHATR